MHVLLRRALPLVLGLALPLAGAGCRDPLAPSGGAAGAAAPAAAAPAAAGHECAEAAGAQPHSQPAAPRLALGGGDTLALGQKLAGLPATPLAQLAKTPVAFAGKTVRLEGTITALCHHRREWFAVAEPGAPQGSGIRVITAPGFLVPENAIGRRVRTEGLVEVAEVPGAAARHYAEGHGLGTPEAFDPARPVKQVVIRAVGAEFL
jgi:hypothetical protein